MRNAATSLARHRHASLLRPHHASILPRALQHDSNVETVLWTFLSSRVQRSIGIGRREDNWLQLYLLPRNAFSTAYTSVHGERPSAEYAKLRKASLESEFGNILGTYSSKSASIFYRFGPFLALYRAAIISFQVLKLTIWHFCLQDMKKRSIKFRETLIRLGPFYVKLGQALSTRPDLLPAVYCQELAKLQVLRRHVFFSCVHLAYKSQICNGQDQIPPYSTHEAVKSIESQLGVPVSEIFADISPEPVAAASLGQVYKAHLHSGELVAVKVQRPGVSILLTLDALLFNMIGGQLKRFAMARRDLLVAVNEVLKVWYLGDSKIKTIFRRGTELQSEHGQIAYDNEIQFIRCICEKKFPFNQVRHMFKEIDYILEGQNAERFASLYGSYQFRAEKSLKGITGDSSEHKKVNCIKVPKIYWNLTRKAVLTMEWIDGIKLTDEAGMEKACLNRKELIDQGLYCSLRQLLEVGFFHADPHPGNLVATADGSLAYFDFGMMGDIPRHFRVGLIQMLVHFVNRDSLGLANDFLSLGFIPEGVDIQLVSEALQASFGDGTRQSQDFQAIMNQLYDIMYEFNFSLPPDYALVIRALGSLEGTAKALDPSFRVVESAYPYVIGRLLADPNPDMRKILRELLIRNNGSIRWNRLERLIAAVSEQASESAEEPPDNKGNSSSPLEWKSFDMRAVVSATENLFQFILSRKGLRVRVFLIRDIISATDIFLQDEVVGRIFNEKLGARAPLESEGDAVLTRVINGFQSLKQAINLAPEVWTSMLIRMSLKPEVHSFALDVMSALAIHFGQKIPQAFWLCLSKLLHKLVEQP